MANTFTWHPDARARMDMLQEAGLAGSARKFATSKEPTNDRLGITEAQPDDHTAESKELAAVA
jgi:hypothetical protein